MAILSYYDQLLSWRKMGSLTAITLRETAVVSIKHASFFTSLCERSQEHTEDRSTKCLRFAYACPAGSRTSRDALEHSSNASTCGVGAV